MLRGQGGLRGGAFHYAADDQTDGGEAAPVVKAPRRRVAKDEQTKAEPKVETFGTVFDRAPCGGAFKLNDKGERVRA